MPSFAERGLLPAGLSDLLPPEAEREANLVAGLMAAFAARGYARVRPPLVEFEDGLLAGAGAALAPHIFRVMDPISQRMMGVRADMTGQVARIAATRLRSLARPLRLSYAGEVLRVRGDELRPERQFGQVGAELIGSDAAASDAEVIQLAADALAAIGARGLTIDLSSPRLAPAVMEAAGLAPERRRALREALDRKDINAVRHEAGNAASSFGALIEATGPAERALAALGAIDLPSGAREEAERLRAVVAALRPAGLDLTVDPVENRGFEYHTGLCFTLFARGVRGELGRGGRYVAGAHFAAQGGEAATGFTLFTDTLLRAVAPEPAARRLYLPLGTRQDDAARWRAQGFVTIAGLAAAADDAAEARRLDCSHVLAGGQPRALS